MNSPLVLMHVRFTGATHYWADAAMGGVLVNDLVMIAERSPSGHRLVYVRLLVEGMPSRGQRPVLVLTSEVLASEEYTQHLAPLQGGFETIIVRREATLRELQELARNRGVARLVVPDSNWRVLQLAFGRRLRRAPRTLALMMRDPRWELLDARGRHLLRTLLKAFSFWLATKRGLAEIVWLREPGHSSSLPHANDPILLDGTVEQIEQEAAAYREHHGLTEDVFWFGLAGVISEAKEPLLIAKAAVSAGRQAGRRTGLALLGPLVAPERVMNEIHEYALGEGLPLVMNFSLHSNYEMNIAIRSLDCVIAAYSNTYGPSSTLGKAAALGVLSIGAGSESQQRFTQTITGFNGVPLEEGRIAEAMADRIQAECPSPKSGLGHEQFCSALLG